MLYSLWAWRWVPTEELPPYLRHTNIVLMWLMIIAMWAYFRLLLFKWASPDGFPLTALRRWEALIICPLQLLRQSIRRVLKNTMFKVWRPSDIVGHPLWAKRLIFKLTGLHFVPDRGQAKGLPPYFKETHKEVFQAYGIPGNWFCVTYCEELPPPEIKVYDFDIRQALKDDHAKCNDS